MSEQEILKKISILNQRIQEIADTEAQAAWAKFIGVYSESIEAITSGRYNEDKIKILDAIEKLLDKLTAK